MAAFSLNTPDAIPYMTHAMLFRGKSSRGSG